MIVTNKTVAGNILLRPAVYRKIVRERPDERGDCAIRFEDLNVLVHMLGYNAQRDRYKVEYEDGTLHDAVASRLVFVDHLHQDYCFD